MGNFAQAKMRARRNVSKAFAVPVVYTAVGTQLPVSAPGLTARLHNKITVDKGDVPGMNGATIMDTATRVIFLREDLVKFGITLKPNDRIVFPEYGITVFLQQKSPMGVGPLLEKWTVLQR